jgi:hypothetical protein
MLHVVSRDAHTNARGIAFIILQKVALGTGEINVTIKVHHMIVAWYYHMQF